MKAAKNIWNQAKHLFTRRTPGGATRAMPGALAGDVVSQAYRSSTLAYLTNSIVARGLFFGVAAVITNALQYTRSRIRC